MQCECMPHVLTIDCNQLYRALPTIETDLMNFDYETNGRHVRDSITAHLSKPDFRFTGVSVSEHG